MRINGKDELAHLDEALALLRRARKMAKAYSQATVVLHVQNECFRLVDEIDTFLSRPRERPADESEREEAIRLWAQVNKDPESGWRWELSEGKALESDLGVVIRLIRLARQSAQAVPEGWQLVDSQNWKLIANRAYELLAIDTPDSINDAYNLLSEAFAAAPQPGEKS